MTNKTTHPNMVQGGAVGRNVGILTDVALPRVPPHRAPSRMAVSTGSVWFESRATNPRGTLPPGRAGEQDKGLRTSFRLSRMPTQFQPSPGPARPSAAGDFIPNALVRTGLGLGARFFLRGVARRLAGSSAGSGGGFPPGDLTRLFKTFRDAEGSLELLEDLRRSFDFIPVSAAWMSLAGMRGVGEWVVTDGEVIAILQVVTGEKMQEMGAQAVVNILHSMATLHERSMAVDDELVGKLMARALAVAGDFNPKEAGYLLWALATMRIEPQPRLLKAMQRRATVMANVFNPQIVSMVLWALATMGIEPEPRLLKAMQRQAFVRAGDFKPQEVANALWSLACFDTSPNQESVQMVESMAVRLLSMREQFTAESKGQMHQWLLFCDYHPEWRGRLPRSVQKMRQEHGPAFREAFALAASVRPRTQVYTPHPFTHTNQELPEF